MNGNREQTNNYTIDGVDMNESIDNLVAYQPSPDALAQISVETNNYAADTGNVAGAVISNVLKSGSNQFHGNAFEYYRNSAMDANSWANNRSGAAKQKRRQDIYGGTLGGPLVKNKLFFFGNYQGTRFDAPGFETVSVAPATGGSGDLSLLTTPSRIRHGVGFAGNQIPASRISPIAAGSSTTWRSILCRTARCRAASPVTSSARPSPPSAPTRATAASTGTRPTTTRSSAASRWPNTSRGTTSGLSRCSWATSRRRRSATSALNWNRVIKPSLVNEVLFGYNHITIVSDTLDWAGIGDANATFNIAGGQPITGLSSIGFGSGLTAIGAGASDTNTLDKTYQVNEKLTWLKGRHSVKFGGQWMHYVQQRFYAGNNGLLGIFGYTGTSAAPRLPISCSIRSAARDGAARRTPGPTSTTAPRCTCRTTSRRPRR